MIGQTFAPLGDNQDLRNGPAGPGAGAPGGSIGPQQAIEVLRLRYPRFFGAGAPAPTPLLTSQGSAALPQQATNPTLMAILQSVLGHFSAPQQVAPSAEGGMVPGSLGGMRSPVPRVQYFPQPDLPGGTAGPNPRPALPQETRPDRVMARGGKLAL